MTQGDKFEFQSASSEFKIFLHCPKLSQFNYYFSTESSDIPSGLEDVW